MFTGIVEEIGKIQAINNKSVEVVCKKVLSDTKIGDSIALNGVCLTVTKLENDYFKADISPETFKITALGNLKSGSFVNLERAMTPTSRLGGHIVSGHIDGVGKIVSITNNKEFYNLELELNSDQSKYVIKKGSITINGISLTVAEISGNRISIAVIPHTYESTNLSCLKGGDLVNIESDVIAKYVEKFLSTRDNKSSIDMDFLQKNGFC